MSGYERAWTRTPLGAAATLLGSILPLVAQRRGRSRIGGYNAPMIARPFPSLRFARRALRAFVVPALCACLAAPASAQGPRIDPTDCGSSPLAAICPNNSPWFDFAEMKLTVTSGPSTGTYVLRLPAGQDIYASYKESSPQGKSNGEVLVIGGDAVAVRSDDPAAGVDFDPVEGPLLMSQLAGTLLERALPKGPAEVAGSRDIYVSESKRILRASTPNQLSLHGPPWSASGRVTRKSSSEIGFALKFRARALEADGSSAGNVMQTFELSGTLAYPKTRPRLPNSFDLRGWRILGTAPGMTAFDTLGQARKALGITPR